MDAHSFPDAVANLLAIAERLPSGRARLEILDGAVKAADAHRDVDAGYWTRRWLIDDAAYCLRYDLYAVTFSWCLAAARKDPVRFSVVELLGHYQHLIGKMVNFPDVSREQYESLFADVLREFRAHGFSLRTIYLERRSVAMDFGDRVMAEEADREWRKYRHDALSSCIEFELARQMEHECFMEDDAAAVRVADQYFARSVRDHGFDAWLSSLSLLPLLRLGRPDDAAARYRISSRESPTAGYVWSRSYRMEYLARLGDFTRGLREFELQLPAALSQPDPLSRYYCLRPAVLLLDRMSASGVGTVALKAPPGVSWGEAHKGYDIAEVRRWVQTEAATIAAQFDRRNGNAYYSEWLRRTINEVDN
jgi:hypothetical protein